ncbi:MAG: hypothetical protein PWQ10_555 [Patescibacteria group bacterium]|nr:hypothetical protein [Patescibacteria group bacterium]
MKNKNKQSGSVHLIIIVALIIGLLGLLGFVFWQNFIQDKAETTMSKQESSDNAKSSSESKEDVSKNEVELTEIAADDLTGTNLALKYPASWHITHTDFEPIDTVVSKSYYISSPDGKVNIKFIVSNAEFGGTCGKEDGDELQYIKTENLSVFSNAKYIEFYSSTGYFAGIHQNSNTTGSIEIGESSCNLGLNGTLTPIKNENNIDNMHLLLSIELPDVGYEGALSVEKFKQIITTDNFNTAKRIIKSLYIKN